jgi:hypothetical protein
VAEKVEHKKIDVTECPRCHGHNTQFADRDDLRETYICRDCQAQDPDEEREGYLYDIVSAEVVGSVQWMTENYTVEHEVHDSDYLAMLKGSDLLAVAQEFIADVEAVGIEQVAHEWPDLAVTYRKARDLIAELDGGTDGR